MTIRESVMTTRMHYDYAGVNYDDEQIYTWHSILIFKFVKLTMSMKLARQQVYLFIPDYLVSGNLQPQM